MAGNALGSTPVLDRATIEAFYQMHDTAGQDGAEQELLPDHYPLVTRKGTVPVAELGTRGLYSQARYRSYAYADYAPVEFAAAEYQPAESSAHYETTDASVRIGDPGEPPAEAAPAAPLQLAAGPATISKRGGAKMIDVQATLAMR